MRQGLSHATIAVLVTLVTARRSAWFGPRNPARRLPRPKLRLPGSYDFVPSEREVILTPYRDGPLLIRGPARILDDEGRELDHRRNPFALCRCGKSRLRPFCDGTHKLVGFRAAGAPGSPGDGLAELKRLGLKLSEQGRPAL